MKFCTRELVGSYSEVVQNIYSKCGNHSLQTFDECFEKAHKDSNIKAIIPESNKTTGNSVEYLIFKYRLNIYEEFYQSIII